MSGLNRGRYVIAVGGPWRLYTHAMPNMRMLGTIQREMNIGALGEWEGILAQINGGRIVDLNQRKARAALDTARAAVGGLKKG